MKTLKRFVLLPLFCGLLLTTACSEQYENDNGIDNGYYNGDDNGNGDTPFNRTITAVVENGNNYNDLIRRVVATIRHDSRDHVIATGTWSNGGFTVVLPETVSEEFLWQWNASDEDPPPYPIPSNSARGKDVDTVLKVAGALHFYAYDEQQRRVGRVRNHYGQAVDNYGNRPAEMFLLYANRDTTILENYVYENHRSIVNMQLRAGWNRVYQIIKTDGAYNVDMLSTDSPGGLRWHREFIAVTGVYFSEEMSVIRIGSNANSEQWAEVRPWNATNRNLVWSSSNPNIATICDRGIVTAITTGTVTITVKTEDGGFTGDREIVVVLPGCNVNTPGWGESLGTVSFHTNNEWTIEGNGIFQIWSDAVTATACQDATFNIADNHWSGGNFSANCRANLDRWGNLDQHGNIRSFPGDLFSWCAVVRFADELCPYPWRVPTQQDFINLDIALGGTGENRNMGNWGDPDWSEYWREFVRDNYIGRWGGSHGGVYWPGHHIDMQGSTSFYWSMSYSMEWSRSSGGNLYFDSDGRIWPQSQMEKGSGLSLRCVRDN